MVRWYFFKIGQTDVTQFMMTFAGRQSFSFLNRSLFDFGWFFDETAQLMGNLLTINLFSALILIELFLVFSKFDQSNLELHRWFDSVVPYGEVYDLRLLHQLLKLW